MVNFAPLPSVYGRCVMVADETHDKESDNYQDAEHRAIQTEYANGQISGQQ